VDRYKSYYLYEFEKALSIGSRLGEPFGQCRQRCCNDLPLQEFNRSRRASLVLAGQFNLNTLGRRRMDEALKTLHSQTGFNKLLFFGFGYQSFVQVMADTQLGINCVALCSCLAEAHSVELAAWILAALWKEYDFPDQYEPSHAQFVALVKARAGVLARSPLSRTIDLMMTREELRQRNQYGARGSLASGATDTAKALRGLFQISNDTVERITVVGGSECAFIAGIAQWLFDFATTVEDRDGSLVFTSAINRDDAQVLVQYTALGSMSPTDLTRTVYLLRDPTEMFIHTNLDDLELFIRTPWTGCLSRVFGSAFHDLTTKYSLTLGEYIGSSARILTAIATGEEWEGGLPYSQYVNYLESSYGHGCIETIRKVFPELSNENLHRIMQHAADTTLNEAIRTVELSIQVLREVCACSDCSKVKDSVKYCLPGMVITVCHVGVVLACAE